MRLRARWMYTGSDPPIPDATVMIENGIMTHIGSGEPDAIDLGNVAILPGLINAHTHLEFSTLKQPLEPQREFVEWIRSVIGWRKNNPFEFASIDAGIHESVQHGVSTVAEIATTDWRSQIGKTELLHVDRVVMFREYLGLSEAVIERQLHDASDFLNATSPANVLPALSPHAPYSVHPRLLEGLCQLAAEKQVPLAMHLAESPQEIELLTNGAGPFRTMLTELGVFRPELFASPRRPLDILHQLDVHVPILVIHGNLLNEEEIDFIAQRPNMSVVYCPRTHAAMQAGEHPWRSMIDRGINVAIGTDSRASNPDLSIWNELVFLHHRYPKLASSELLKLATKNAAHALGLHHGGQITNGNPANFCLIHLDADSNPEVDLFQYRSRPLAVMSSGNWVVAPAIG